METQQQEFSETATVRYRRTWQGYEQAVRSGGSVTLSSYCKSFHVNYRGMTKWMSAMGLSARGLKREVRDGAPVSGQGISEEASGLFVQFTPSPAASCPGRLRGVAISFPDGVGLTLQESTVEEVMGMAMPDALMERKAQRGTNRACSGMVATEHCQAQDKGFGAARNSLAGMGKEKRNES